MNDICDKSRTTDAATASDSTDASAKAYIREQGAPIVVKTDGLAAGKGVTVAQTLDEALNAVDDAMLNGVFGDAGAEVVVEEFMAGEELSFFAFSDGKSVLPLASAQDHKAVYDGDKGPNTGGMGAYSPAPVCTPEIEQQVIDRCIQPLIDGMSKEGKPYRGVLFCGLMIDETGPRVVEYNVRFGDPECQVLMMRLKSDLLPVLVAACDDVLDTVDLRWHNQAALTVVMAAKGYPGSYEKNTEIENVEAAGADDDVTIFHAGTARADDGSLRATGGRVLNVTARGDTVTAAQARAYEAVDKISWEQGFCRRDIGWRAVEREQQK